MKKYIVVLSLLLLTFCNFAQAQQFSMGIGYNQATFYGSRYIYPIGTPNEFPVLRGAKLEGIFSQGSHRLQMGYSYYFYAPEIVYNYYGITTKPSMMELELNYNYYLIGYSEEGGLYALIGGSGTMLNLNSTIPDATVSEANLFNSKTSLGTFVNLGLGFDLNFGKTSFFGEGKTAIHTNSYVNSTTIWETQFNYFWSVSAGFRFFLTEPTSFVHPRKASRFNPFRAKRTGNSHPIRK